MIEEYYRERIEKYITGIVNNNSCKLYAIYVNPEHIHVLVSRSPALSEEQLISIIAVSSERFINQNNMTKCKFSWQKSASAFSVSKSENDKLYRYIFNQPKHHRKVTFVEEYDKFIQYYQETLHKNKVIR